MTPTHHMVILDVQAQPGLTYEHLRNVGTYMVEKRHPVVVCIGDFADMRSLRRVGSRRQFNRERYDADIQAAHSAMEALLGPLREHNVACNKVGVPQYRPRLVMCLGNHEHRIERLLLEQPHLEGEISLDDLRYAEYGWEVHPFQHVVEIDGVAYAHFFSAGPMGRPIATAQRLLQQKHQSCVAGHIPVDQIATGYTAGGRRICALLGGATYVHEEPHLGQHRYWRGIHVLHDVHQGQFEPMQVSLDYLARRYTTNRGTQP